MARPAVRAVVAAAGRSSRFLSGHKALPPPWGGGLLGRVMGTLAVLGLDRPVVVVGHRGPEVAAEAAALGAEVVANPDPDRGMFSSAALGLAAAVAAGAEGVLFWPVDAAFVSPAAVLSLISFWLESEAGDPGLAVLPEHRGRLGHPPLLGRELIGRVLRWSGAEGLKGALAALAGRGAEAASVAAGLRPAAGPGRGSRLRYHATGDPGVLRDVDTVDDLRRALAAGIHRPPAPGVPEVLALLRLAGPPRKMIHALTVGTLALRMALALGSGRPELAFAGGLLHDVDHRSRLHDLAGARRMIAMGWGELAIVVGAHTEMPEGWARRIGYAGPTSDRHRADAALYEDAAPEVEEAAMLVHLADKYAKGGRLVTIEERFGAFLRYGGPAEALAHVQARWDMTRALQARLHGRLGRPPREAATAPCGHPLERLAERLLGGPVGGPAGGSDR
jgi:molybdenum cofactor cytidylyltransferase